MSWFYLFLAGLFEMTGVAMINSWHKHRNWQSFLMLIGGFSASFLLLAQAMKEIPMSTAYAVWTGIGASGGAILGMFFYGEPKEAKRIFFIALVLGAAIGLKLIS